MARGSAGVRVVRVKATKASCETHESFGGSTSSNQAKQLLDQLPIVLLCMLTSTIIVCHALEAFWVG